MSLIVTDKRFHSGTGNFDCYDVKVYFGKDERTGRQGFVSEYPYHPLIEKTETIGAVHDYADDTDKPGQISVHFRSGTDGLYAFECWATGWCEQFGINVSADGTKVYVISDLKGLWCYSVQGELLWKTRLTTASHVFDNRDGTITCMTSSNLVMLDSNTGKVLKKRSVIPYDSDKISPSLIAAAISDNTVAIIDSVSLEILQKISLRKLGIDRYDAVAVNDRRIAISGVSEQFVDVPNQSRRRIIEEHFLFLLDRETVQVIGRYALKDYNIRYCPFLDFCGNELIVQGFIGESGNSKSVRIPIDQ